MQRVVSAKRCVILCLLFVFLLFMFYVKWLLVFAFHFLVKSFLCVPLPCDDPAQFQCRRHLNGLDGTVNRLCMSAQNEATGACEEVCDLCPLYMFSLSFIFV